MTPQRHKLSHPTSKGFTLIELMLAVAIMGILCMLALPFFASTIAKTREGVTKVNLGVLRAALSIYYNDMDGRYPKDPVVLANGGKYLEAIPKAYYPRTPNNILFHYQNNYVSIFYLNIFGWLEIRMRYGNMAAGGLPPFENAIPLAFQYADESGGWLYDGTSATASPTFGKIIASCSHRDIQGQQWSSY